MRFRASCGIILSMIRPPAVAGRFYPLKPNSLKREIEACVRTSAHRERAIGAISPHAGIMYSGPVAGEVFSRIEFPDTFVLIGPNHQGIGSDISIMSDGVWQIPTGSVGIDAGLSALILDEASGITDDPDGHMLEHSLEVQLPFIRHFSDSALIVPITVMSARLPELMDIGSAIARAVRKHKRSVTIVASSDMSHYVTDEEARRLDNIAIERVLALDPEGLYNTVIRKGITMCGFMPSVIMLQASLELGATKAELVKYATSGDVSGDMMQVVGYAGILVK